jgi:hypothetical protein
MNRIPIRIDPGWSTAATAASCPTAACPLAANGVLPAAVSPARSPADDDDRTIDLPVDEQFKGSASYAYTGEGFNYSIGASLMYMGDGKVDQTSQGVRFKGEFDTNYALFVGGTVRYEF